MSKTSWRKVLASSAAAMALLGSSVIAAQPATAATTTISVSFGDWRCASSGGGKVVAVQMGSQYGSVPKTLGRTIKIKAKVNASNNLTGVIWCKRPWYKGGVTSPVYNIHQGLWVSKNGQNFNV